MTGAIADSACGYAAYTLMAAEDSVLTVEYKINLLAPADGEELVARARVVRSGKTLKICMADVFVRKAGRRIIVRLCLRRLCVWRGRRIGRVRLVGQLGTKTPSTITPGEARAQ